MGAILYDGHVTWWIRSLHTPQIAAGQSIPDHPPRPAFRMIESSLG
jgi:hypothetical protein